MLAPIVCEILSILSARQVAASRSSDEQGPRAVFDRMRDRLARYDSGSGLPVLRESGRWQ